MELLVHFLVDSIHFKKEYKQSPLWSSRSLSLMMPCNSMRNMSRRPVWSSWSISFLIPYTFNEAYKQKSSVIAQAHLSSDSISFLIRSMRRSPLWSSCSISSMFPYTCKKEYKQTNYVELLINFHINCIDVECIMSQIHQYIHTLLARTIS